jgi:anti-sigma factor RsiW
MGERHKDRRAANPRTLAKFAMPIATCKNETDLIADYLSSNLSPRVATAFEEHLRGCRDCAAFLQTYKKTMEVTRTFLQIQSLINRPRNLALRAPTGHGEGR